MLKLPAIEGIIRRRILVNYRIDPEVLQRELPSAFRPKLHNGMAIGGICLIRLEQVRPCGWPSFLGISSENAAHRMAVRWKDEAGKEREGVYIPRRDTNQLLNQLAGGRLFPGEHHAAKFEITDDVKRIHLSMRSDDGVVAVAVRGRAGERLPDTSGFASLAEASAFFEPGAVGYSATHSGVRLDGIELRTKTWKVEPLAVEHVHSSYFEDETRFPRGSVAFDCALVMRDIEHEWHGVPEMVI